MSSTPSDPDVAGGTTVPAASAQLKTTSAEQELLARHLADELRARLAGDHAERRIISHRRPSQVLQLGILPALPQPDPDSNETPQQLARRMTRPPSQLGYTLRLAPGGGQAEIEVEAEFSVYVQRYPELNEQRESLGSAATSGDHDDDHGTGDDGSSIRTGNGGGQSPPLTGSSDLVEKWERLDLVTGRMPVKLDMVSGDRGSERVPLDTELKELLGPVFSDPNTVYPFATSQQLPNAAVHGSDTDYRQAIAVQEGDARTRLLQPPQVAVQVDWRKLPDGN